ncbi:hypothetical protein [Flavobacterium luteum]|uniref:GNAT family N-acetyltransferase n=1 Tax=Flavobacterium luteum TaxID=2026654 RepID=A0A7J5ADX1_9FLAO|nr:hypothetical protein [Flavobacterium luteum]KAB1155777.1 hypothetical protein F6464_09645 [Flavobacterium luteum]
MIKNIDVFIYYINKEMLSAFPEPNYLVTQEEINQNKTRYSIVEKDRIIHESFLFNKLFLLRLIKKRGPTIGDCKTIQEFRGKSIYPFVINHIAKDQILNHNKNEVFIIVNTNNHSSIIGIEKAGFKLHIKIKAKRFFIFHYNVIKTFYF